MMKILRYRQLVDKNQPKYMDFSLTTLSLASLYQRIVYIRTSKKSNQHPGTSVLAPTASHQLIDSTRRCPVCLVSIVSWSKTGGSTIITQSPARLNCQASGTIGHVQTATGSFVSSGAEVVLRLRFAQLGSIRL